MPIEDFKTTMKDITPNGVITNWPTKPLTTPKSSRKKAVYVRRSFASFYYGMTCFFAFIIGRPILLSLVTL